MLTRSKAKISKEGLFSATSLVNYIRNDGIIDYFDIVSRNNYTIDTDNEFKLKKRKLSEMDDMSIKQSNTIKNNVFKLDKKSSFDYIVENGYIFENIIIEQIKDKMKSNGEIEKLAIINTNDFSLRYNKTYELLKEKKVDIVLGGLLINKSNNTYGFPDLIVSGYWISKYIEESMSNLCIDSNSYYIIDIKSSSINLINSGENVSSGLLFDGYKAQIYVYTQALNSMLNSNIKLGFILGKKYNFTANKSKIVLSNPFAKLGIIDYDYEKSNGTDFKELILNAIKWKKKLEKEWKNLHLAPIDDDNLYPNMKNHYDKNYKKIKKEVAYENKEITLLWNVGIKNRKIAWDNGIKKFTDEKIKPELLGINNSSSKYDIIDKMLFINKQNNQNVIISSKNNYLNWQTEYSNEFFVDFETYSEEKIYDENSDNFTESLNTQIIYMIGVIYLNKKSKMLEFKCFIIDFEGSKLVPQNIEKHHKCTHNSYIFCNSEKELITKFVDFIKELKKPHLKIEDYYKETRLIHWSQAEPIIFNKKIKEHRLVDYDFELPWYDLLKIFKYEKQPIVIKDCFSFGLKDIIKNLNSHGLINLVWPELDDGLLSSFIAKDIYEKVEKNNIKSVFNMINIVEYNYIDCMAISKLLVWMRNTI